MPASPQVWRAPEDVPADLPVSVVTIGVFDGVHRGHQQVIGRACTGERPRRAARWWWCTFDPHPMAVVRPGSHPPCSPAGRTAELLASAGVDARLRPAVHAELAAASRPRTSSTSCWSAPARARGRGGARTSGSATGPPATSTLLADGSASELRLRRVDAGRRWSATRPAPAGRRPTSAPGRRGRRGGGRRGARPPAPGGGRRRARRPARPRARLSRRRTCRPRQAFAVPADGVYAGWLEPARRAGRAAAMPAAISVGTNPTFDGRSGGSRRTCWTATTSTCTASRSPSSSSPGCAGSVRFDRIEPLLAQMARGRRRRARVLGVTGLTGLDRRAAIRCRAPR